MLAYIAVVNLDRYGPRAHGEEVMSMYANSRALGFGPEVIKDLKKNWIVKL